MCVLVHFFKGGNPPRVDWGVSWPPIGLGVKGTGSKLARARTRVNKRSTYAHKTCPQSNRGFWRCPGGNLVPPFQFVALFFACAREDCAPSEYPKSADCFNDILQKRHRFWAGSPRKMAKPAHSQIGGFGGVGGGTWSRRFSLWRFFLHVHGKTVHFLNIQEV